MQNANQFVDTAQYPIGCVIFPTAVAAFAGVEGIYHNRDMLAGPPKGFNEPPWCWGIRITKQGSNGYLHEPWHGFILSNGTACATVGPFPNNCTVTFVRVPSQAEALEKGPDAYGPSR